jgi:branched-chain amino acid transport system permease protein
MGIELISNHQMGMLFITLIMLVILFFFFRFTRVGLAMTAAAAEPTSARLVGIRVGWMIALGWGMAAAIGAVAGILIAPVVFLEPQMMISILVIDNLAGTYIPVVGTELRLTIALTIIIAMLLIRPQGIIGRRIVERV